VTETATQELHISRIFEAPRELVYQAFMDPDQFAQWFGPVGYSVPRGTVKIEARVGGRQRFDMVEDANPANVASIDATFAEVVENELIVGYQDVDGISGQPGVTRMTLRVEFHDEPGGRTRIELRQWPYTKEIAAGAHVGWMSSFTKLDAVIKRCGS
jgi:uncharacterized protein YndB with AHSA1/START domain